MRNSGKQNGDVHKCVFWMPCGIYNWKLTIRDNSTTVLNLFSYGVFCEFVLVPLSDTFDMEEVTKHSVHTLVFRSLKRSHDMFISDNIQPPPIDEKSERVKIACKIRDEYGMVRHLPQPKEVKPPAIKQNNSNHIPQDNGPGKLPPPHLFFTAHLSFCKQTIWQFKWGNLSLSSKTKLII